MLHKGDKLNVPPALKQEVEENPKISVMYNVEVDDLGGDELLSEIVVKNVKTGEFTTLKADEEDGFFGLFGFTGKKTTGMFEGILDMENGYIKTNEKMETNVPGVYAAGDVRVTPLRQVVTACADGAIAAMQCGKYISTLK
jgi:thioredoxin reductase (NADPH)